MERSLHRQLKERYGPEMGGRSEVVFGGFRVDARGMNGCLIEIQSGPLRLLKPKLVELLPSHQINVVKPIIVRRRLIRRLNPTGLDLSSRNSPKRGDLLEVFDELVGIVHLFPHANLKIDLLAVEVDEIRIPRCRRPGYLVVDRVLREVVRTIQLRVGQDLWVLLPDDLPARFTTKDLAQRLSRTRGFAQRVTFCLRCSGAVEVVDKVGNQRVYSRIDLPTEGFIEWPGRVR